jgi:hypothetical protein
MHIRHSKLAHQAARAGLVLAVAAGMVAVAATPSFAAVAVLSQTKGPAAGTNKLTVTGTTFAAGAAVLFTTAACPATYTAPTTGIIGASAVVVNTVAPTSLTVTVPALTATTSYNVCSYAGAVAGNAQTSATTGAPYLATAVLSSLAVSPTSAGAGTTTTATDAATAFGAGSVAAEFNLASCPATYAATSSSVVAGTPGTATGTSSVPITVPTGLSQIATYYVCVYTGSTVGTSALISGTSSATFSIPPLVVAPTTGPAAGTNTIVATDTSATFTGTTAVEFNQAICPSTYTTPSGTIIAATPASFTTTTLTIVAPALPAHTYYVCAYAGTTAGSSTLISGMGSPGYTSQAAGTLTLNIARGTTTGGTTLTATDATASFGASTPIEYDTAACPATYVAPSATVIASTATSTVNAPTVLNITTPALPTGSYSICAYTGTAAGTSALISGTATGAFGAFNVLTLSTSSGPTGGGNSITVTTSGGTFIANQTAVTFDSPSSAPCAATYVAANGTSVNAVTVLRVLLPNKLALTVPSTVTTGNGPDYNVCAYTGTSVGTSALIASSSTPYVVAAAPTITSISPAAGSTQGGTVITVTGQNLDNVQSVSIGGVALTGVTPISSTAFTAVTPAHSAGGPFGLTVVTQGGPYTMAGAFSYANGIVVAPNKGANSGSVDVDIQGVGFSSLPFNPNGTNTDGGTPDDATGHVYLVKGIYNPAQTNAGYKANGEVLECVSVLVISDSELVCTLYLAGDQPTRVAFPAGGAVATASMVAGSDVITDTGHGFTTADLGMTVTGTGVPGGATIVAVRSTDEAVLSVNATGAVAGVTLSAPKSVAATTSTAGSTAVSTTTGGGFAATDVGRTITGAGIQPGTTISGFTDATHVTISLPAGTTATGAVKVGSPAIPTGTYTVTVVSDGSAGASGSSFFQSVVSGGSTFTVAGF